MSSKMLVLNYLRYGTIISISERIPRKSVAVAQPTELRRSHGQAVPKKKRSVPSSSMAMAALSWLCSCCPGSVPSEWNFEILCMDGKYSRD